MSLEVWNTVAAFGTFFVIFATAIAAVIELKHMQSRNALHAVLSLQREFSDPDLQEALRYVQLYLGQKLHDTQYRAELDGIGFVDSRVHLEMRVCNWFNEMGLLVKNDIVSEDAFLDQFGRMVDYYWKLLAPVIAILRRRRGDEQYQNFEYLASLSRKWHAQHPTGVYPKDVPRMPVDDVWQAEDESGTGQLTPVSG
ncbi:MAG TPA: hypothetical protein VGQ96_02025 [Candidatus Eremiobacteraceae bacterium]|nr:hypothetical protein [Candidatus Eremiobacteraceae bacterium]